MEFSPCSVELYALQRGDPLPGVINYAMSSVVFSLGIFFQCAVQKSNVRLQHSSICICCATPSECLFSLALLRWRHIGPTTKFCMRLIRIINQLLHIDVFLLVCAYGPVLRSICFLFEWSIVELFNASDGMHLMIFSSYFQDCPGEFSGIDVTTWYASLLTIQPSPKIRPLVCLKHIQFSAGSTDCYCKKVFVFQPQEES